MKPLDVRERAKRLLRRLWPRRTRDLTDAHWDALHELGPSFDEIRGPVTVRTLFGPYGGILVAAAILLPVALGRWHGIPGALAGLLLSVALVYAWRAIRSIYTTACIYPGGISGHEDAQRRIGKYGEAGTELHHLFRMMPSYRIGRFVYGSNPPRKSWRVYALAVLILVALYRFPLIGIAILSLVVAYVLHAFTSSRTPIALYLGPSTFDAIRLFWRIRNESGIAWASLLKDPLELPEQLQDTADERLDVLLNGVYSNPWSLRCDGNEEWLAIVRDLMATSIVIVVKVADVPAVRSELELLRTSHPLARIVVVADDPSLVDLVPAALRPALMSEAQALSFLGLIASKPRAFLPLLRERTRLFAAA